MSSELRSALVKNADSKRLQMETFKDEIETLENQILALDFEEVDKSQSEFIANYEALENSEEKLKLKEARFQMHGILRKTIDKIVVYNGETISPWEIEGNVSSKLIEALNERGISGQHEIEKYLEKPAGKRLFNHSERFFSVRFKNGTVRVVHPYENVTYQSVSEKLARFRG